MLKKIGLGILITVFLISGLASMGTEQAIYNELTDIPDADVNEVNFDRELVETEDGVDANIGSSISTRAIDIDLNDIYWSKMANNRNVPTWTIRATECADLNHDGLMDIVDGGASGIYASLQNPDGSWSSMHTGLPFQSSGNLDITGLELGDINRDGWTDIVAINYSSSTGDSST